MGRQNRRGTQSQPVHDPRPSRAVAGILLALVVLLSGVSLLLLAEVREINQQAASLEVELSSSNEKLVNLTKSKPVDIQLFMVSRTRSRAFGRTFSKQRTP
jgi:hypothetical protein